MRNLRYFRRLPRLLQVLSLLGILLLIVALVTLTSEILTATSAFVVFLNSPHASSLAGQPPMAEGAGLSLVLLGGGCAWPSTMYLAHLRRPGRAPWPDTWQMQALATLALVTLPLFSLALPLLFASHLFAASGLLFLGQSALNLVEAGLLVAVNFWSMIVAIS